MSMQRTLERPAVVADFLATGIGIIHCLSRAPIDVVTVAPAWPPLVCFGKYSRFPRMSVSYSPRRGETLVATLLRLSSGFDGRPVLFPGSDDHLAAMMSDRARLSERFHVPVAAHLGLEFFEKNWQYQLADRVGVPTPRYATFIAGEAPDVQGFRFPLILKPSARLKGAAKAVFRYRIVRTPAELEKALADLGEHLAGRGFQIAEDIPGLPDQLYTVGAYSSHDGIVLRSYTGRKLSQFPFSHGHGSICQSVVLPDKVVRMAEALLNGAGFHGISQVEFKFDARDNRYKLIEINGRSWSWIKLAAFSGVNLPLIQYYDLTGDPQLAEAVARPQENGQFFVNEYYTMLNRSGAEQRLIRELCRNEARVLAAGLDGEWRLSFAFRVASFLKAIRHRLSASIEPALPQPEATRRRPAS